MTLNKDLIKKFAHITSSAAVATYKYIGKKDKNLALIAMKSNSYAYQFLDKSLKKDKDILKLKNKN